jgi:hypothetical protein
MRNHRSRRAVRNVGVGRCVDATIPGAAVVSEVIDNRERRARGANSCRTVTNRAVPLLVLAGTALRQSPERPERIERLG